MMRLLIATTNTAKVVRVRKLTHHFNLKIVTLDDLSIEHVDVQEGSDVRKNSEMKALAYRAFTDLPILANDTAFYINGELLDPAKVRRNALGNMDEKNLTQDQRAEAFLSFYKTIASRRGGAVPAYWEDIYSLSLPNGETHSEQSRRDVILTDVARGKVDPFAPMRCLYIVKVTGKYVADETEEEEALELKPVQNAIENLLSLIR